MIRQELNPVTCKLDENDVGVLGLAPCHHSEKSQVRQTDQVWYHHQLQVSSLAVDLQWCYCPLHYLRREKREEKRRKFYIYPDVTHTHTHIAHKFSLSCQFHGSTFWVRVYRLYKYNMFSSRICWAIRCEEWVDCQDSSWPFIFSTVISASKIGIFSESSVPKISPCGQGSKHLRPWGNQIVVTRLDHPLQ